MESPFVYDLLSHMRKHPSRACEISEAVRLMDSIAAGIAEGKSSRDDLVKAQAKLIPLCGFNFGLLIPSCFPTFMPERRPLDFLQRPFMFAMTCLAPDSVVTLMAGRQVGKCVTAETDVVTDRGTMTMTELFDQASALR